MCRPVAYSFALLAATGTYALHMNEVDSFRRGRFAKGQPSYHQLYSYPEDGSTFTSTSKSTASSSSSKKLSLKEIVLIRHGQTFMNEYIGGRGISFGEPGFTDIFQEPTDREKYHDSPLSDVGIHQAKSLDFKLQELKDKNPGALEALGLVRPPNANSTSANANFLNRLDLVVTSPLTRALQTFEFALYDHIVEITDKTRDVPILAMAAASERLYLVSDMGKPKSELALRYPFVDFDTSFMYSHENGIQVLFDAESRGACDEKNCIDEWHFIPSKETADNYVEWRPHGQGQSYACLGEPADHFDRRMSDLYYWLESREENCIAIVCHAGVIDWMTSGEEFANCELRVYAFDKLRPRALQNRRCNTG